MNYDENPKSKMNWEITSVHNPIILCVKCEWRIEIKWILWRLNQLNVESEILLLYSLYNLAVAGSRVGIELSSIESSRKYVRMISSKYYV